MFFLSLLKKRASPQPGFTLIELLIVASIFSLTALIATTVFTNIQRTQRNVLSRQRVVADGRYVLEGVTRTAKLGIPDYAFYDSVDCTNTTPGATAAPCNIAQPQSMLVVRDQTNVRICYELVGGNLLTTTNCTAASIDWTDITPSDLIINQFMVYIRPGGDPYRAPPAASSDCHVSLPSNYRPTDGTCGCAGFGDNTSCFSGQTCVQSDANLIPAVYICKNSDTQPTVTVFMKTTATNTGNAQPISSTMQTTVSSRVYRR